MKEWKRQRLGCIALGRVRPYHFQLAMQHDSRPVDADTGQAACLSIPDTHCRQAVVHGILGVIRREKRLLLIRRAPGVRVGGLWCFPGGHIEPGESEPDALIREMHEELGLLVRPIQRLFILSKHEGRLLLHWWSAEVVGGELSPDPREVAAVQWMTPDEMRAMPLTENPVPADFPPHLIAGSLSILEYLGI